MSDLHDARYYLDLPVQLVDDDKIDRKGFSTCIARTAAVRTDISNFVIGKSLLISYKR